MLLYSACYKLADNTMTNKTKTLGGLYEELCHPVTFVQCHGMMDYVAAVPDHKFTKLRSNINYFI